MGDSLAIVRAWNEENEIRAREMVATKTASSEDAPAITDVVPSPANVDTQAVTVEAEKQAVATKRKKPALRVIQGGAKGVAKSVPNVTDLPTPGGIAFVLLFTLFLLFSISKTANGQTRLQLMWAAINGSASLNNDAAFQGTPAVYNPAAGGTPDTSGPVLVQNPLWYQ